METSADWRSDRGEQEGRLGDRASGATSTGVTACLHDCNLSEDSFPSRFADFHIDARSIIEQSRLDRVLAAEVDTQYGDWGVCPPPPEGYHLSSESPATPPGPRRRVAKRTAKGLTTFHPRVGHWTWTRADLGSLRCASMARSTKSKRKRCRTAGMSMAHMRMSALDVQTRQIELSQKIYDLDVKRGIPPLNSRHRYVVVDDANVYFPSSTPSSYKDHPPANALPAEM